jgi:hypothetical protein
MFVPLIIISIILFFSFLGFVLVLGGGNKSKGVGILKAFQVDESGLTGCYLAIQCRAQGLVSFILNLMKLEPNTTLVVSEGVISIEISSIKGKSKTMTPITQVAGFHGGYSKPIDVIITGILCAVFFNIGDWLIYTLSDVYLGLSFFGLLIMLVCIFLYIFSKKLYMGYETSGGETYMLEFKKGVLGSMSVDIDKVNHALDLVNGVLHSSALGHNSVQVRKDPQIIGKDATLAVVQEPITQAMVPVQEQQPQAEFLQSSTPVVAVQEQQQGVGPIPIMPSEDNSRVRLYSQFANTQISVGSFEQFNEAMNDRERRLKFYNLALSHNINLGTYEQFEQKIMQV